MSHTRTFFAALAIVAATSGAAFAQAQPKPAEVDNVMVPGVGSVTVLTYQAAFVSADPATRRVVLETPNGKRWAVIAPPLLGDIMNMPAGRQLTIRVAPGIVTALGKAHKGKPGEVLNEVVIDAGQAGWPVDFGAREVTLTTIFVDINLTNGTVTFEGPDGAARTLKAANTKVLQDLSKVNVGDLATVTYLEGLSVVAR